MTILLAPQVSLSPTTYSTEGAEVVATVSLHNRPVYTGHPTGIPNLTTITPKIICSRSPSGIMPFHISVSACETTHNGDDGGLDGNAYMFLHYKWDFGDPSGTELFYDPYTKTTTNLNIQYSPEASYIYRTPGTYTITLTVTGKKTNGEFVTATTTDLYTLGEYNIFLGQTSGGTFTLSFNAETTAAIAHNATNAQILSALTALPSLTDTNVWMSYYRVIQFRGDLVDTGYTFTGNFSGITQTIANTPRIIVEESSSVATSVVVEDMSDLVIRYYDSNYTGGSEDGSIDHPYSTTTTMKSWIEGGTARGTALARGGVYPMASAIAFPLIEHSNHRIFAYGTGAKPIIQQTAQAAYFNLRCGTGQLSQPDGRMMNDIVFSNIDVDFQAGSDWASFSPVIVSQSNIGAYVHARLKNLVFDSVDWSVSAPELSPGVIPVARFLNTTMPPTTNSGTIFSRMHYWGCDLDNTGANSLANVSARMGHWCSFTGCRLGGGGYSTNPDLDKIHILYPSVIRHASYKYLRFHQAYKSFCVNTNAHLNGGKHSYTVFDGCDFTGTQNGIDLSNSTNSYSVSNYGYFDQVVINCCNFYSGEITSERMGIYGNNFYRVTCRHSKFWKNTTADVNFDVPSNTPWTPPVYFWHNNFTGRLNIKGTPNPQKPVLLYNTWDVDNGDYCLMFFNGSEAYIDEYEANHNTFNCSLASPFSEFDWAAWQTAGNDANGANADPLWEDPNNGLFIADPVVAVDWPAGWTSLEYSLDGLSWSSYTEGADITVATSIDELETLYFRGRSPAPVEGTYTLTVTTDASSVDVLDESSTATIQSLVTVIPVLYLAINTSAGSLLISRNAD